MNLKRLFLMLVIALPLVFLGGACSKDGEKEAGGEEKAAKAAAKVASAGGAEGPVGVDDESEAAPEAKASAAGKKARKSKKAAGKKGTSKAEPSTKNSTKTSNKTDDAEPGTESASPAAASADDAAEKAGEDIDDLAKPGSAPPRLADAGRFAKASKKSRKETKPAAAPAGRAKDDAESAQVEYLVRDEKLLDLTRLVSLESVRALLKEPGLTREEPLTGSLPGREYNGARFFTAKNDTLGVTVQVWRFVTTIEARRRFDVFSARFPNAEETSAVGTQGFFGHAADVMHLGYLEQAKKSIVVISCSEDLCSPKDLYLVAKSVAKKL